MKKFIAVSNTGEPQYVVTTNDPSFILPDTDGGYFDVTDIPKLHTTDNVKKLYDIKIHKNKDQKVESIELTPKDDNLTTKKI